ncbi:hypothetical protein HMPREF9093_00769, partial [Fusobacterium sp. oral taxon 370 str. F0437]|uniref:HipA domain-containing protein n=1 Tax=Fusobacterium sp. oral taxon 370 TaxID=712288 RepID=UPI000234A3B5
QLTLNLTKNFEEVEKLFRLMCFNVFSHNRDDHSKNFSFIYNEDLNKWELSPAYDLTYSYSINGKHATTINGNGVFAFVPSRAGQWVIRAVASMDRQNKVVHDASLVVQFE